MGRLSSNVISGPGTWGMTTDHSILMNIIPQDHGGSIVIDLGLGIKQTGIRLTKKEKSIRLVKRKGVKIVKVN